MLWGGRFNKQLSEKAFKFNESLSIDKKLYEEDIKGSIAHAKMLKKQNIITEIQADNIIKGLNEILSDIQNNKYQIEESEDIHSFVESKLISKIGDDAKRLHTARSRNDQVALDMKMYVRKRINETIFNIESLVKVLLKIKNENKETIMPGFTHMQKAQPITLALHIRAYVEMFNRDKSRLLDTNKRLNECPLGACALAGTVYNIDRDFVAKELGFDKATENTMDSVSDRDYLIEYIFDLSIIMMHLSRFCEEIIMWNSNEYRFINISDEYSTGSSIMPQKKNPDIAELIRGKTGNCYGSLISLLTIMKSLPLAYNKDMQEDKINSLYTIDDVNDCIILMSDMLDTATFNKKQMEKSCLSGFINATDVADYLTKKNIPFRDAHKMVGELVLYCEKNNKNLNDLTLEEYNKICDNKVENDIYNEISLISSVKNRKSKGAAFSS